MTVEKFQKLYTILFKTEHFNINRAEIITLIDDEIGQGNIAKILKLRCNKRYSDSTGEVITLFNENWNINCQSGYGLDALNIYNSNKKWFTYGKEDQDTKILDDFRIYFIDECIKSDIMVDVIDYTNQIMKDYEQYGKNNQEKDYRSRSVF